MFGEVACSTGSSLPCSETPYSQAGIWQSYLLILHICWFGRSWEPRVIFLYFWNSTSPMCPLTRGTMRGCRGRCDRSWKKRTRDCPAKAPPRVSERPHGTKYNKGGGENASLGLAKGHQTKLKALHSVSWGKWFPTVIQGDSATSSRDQSIGIPMKASLESIRISTDTCVLYTYPLESTPQISHCWRWPGRNTYRRHPVRIVFQAWMGWKRISGKNNLETTRVSCLSLCRLTSKSQKIKLSY